MSDQELQDLFEQSEDALFRRIVDRQEGALGMAERERLGMDGPSATELARWDRALDALERQKRREEPPPGPPQKRSLRRVLLLAAIIAAVLALSAAAVRVYVLNWTEQATEKYLQFQAGESAAERVARWQEAYVPSTVPRDYQISAAAYSESSKFIEYANTAGDRLLFFQYPGSAAVRIDTEAADREVDWFGQKAYLFLKEGTAMVTWDGGDCIFSIEYDPEAVTGEEIKEMAKSLEWK